MPHDDARRATIERRFLEFGREFGHLPLYGSLARELAEDPEAARLLLAAQPGQDRPVLWFAALHDLVLQRPDLPAARWYPSVVGRAHVATGDPWPDVRDTVLAHREELTATIATHATQTNEVNRCVYLSAGLAAATRDRSVDGADSIALVELGASAGLLLGIDRYAVRLARHGAGSVAGDPGSPVWCEGADRSPSPVRIEPLPRITGRAGIDREPVRLDEGRGVRWLTACLWPDVPGRVERFRAAVDVMQQHPPTLVRGDLVDDLSVVVAAARTDEPATSHVVVFSSWALTYVEASRRSELADRLTALGRELPALSWLTAEPPGAAPGISARPGPRPEAGGTVLGLRRWRDGAETQPLVLGTCHPHGDWIDVAPLPSGSPP